MAGDDPMSDCSSENEEFQQLDAELDRLNEYMNQIESRVNKHNSELKEMLRKQKEERERRENEEKNKTESSSTSEQQQNDK